MNVETTPPTEHGKFHFIPELSRPLLPHEHNQAHLFQVLAPDHLPLPGADLIVGYPGGDPKDELGQIGIENHFWHTWQGRPAVLRGRHYKAKWAEIVHTTSGSGGESAWVHLNGKVVQLPNGTYRIDTSQPTLFYSSDIVHNIPTSAPHIGTYIGWYITFQLQLQLQQKSTKL